MSLALFEYFNGMISISHPVTPDSTVPTLIVEVAIFLKIWKELQKITVLSHFLPVVKPLFLNSNHSGCKRRKIGHLQIGCYCVSPKCGSVVLRDASLMIKNKIHPHQCLFFLKFPVKEEEEARKWKSFCQTDPGTGRKFTLPLNPVICNLHFGKHHYRRTNLKS